MARPHPVPVFTETDLYLIQPSLPVGPLGLQELDEVALFPSDLFWEYHLAPFHHLSQHLACQHPVCEHAKEPDELKLQIEIAFDPWPATLPCAMHMLQTTR